MLYDKKCTKCGNKYTYIGSAQNGFMWLCKKCNHIDWAPKKNNTYIFLFNILYIYLLYNNKTNNMKKLNPIQAQYIKDCELLQALNLPTDLFDELYLQNYKNKK